MIEKVDPKYSMTNLANCVLLFILVASHAGGLRIEVSTISFTEGFAKAPSGELLLAEGTQLFLRCSVKAHFSQNRSLVWEVGSQAWGTMWMNSSEIGLNETASASEDSLTSILYISRLGVKDVGRYRCIELDYSHEEINIDYNDGLEAKETTEEGTIDNEKEGIYVFVHGGPLTPMQQGQVKLLESTKKVPCLPSHPDVEVTLTSGGQDLTSKYTFDPRFGFSLIPTSSPQHLAYASATCYLSDGSKTESLQFSVRSSKMASKLQSATIPVTLQAAEEVVEGLEDIVIDCKVELDAKLDEEVEVEWRCLLFLFTEFILVSQLFRSQRDLMFKR